MLEIKLDEAVKEIRELNAKTVLVQLPEGLKQHTTKIVQTLEGTGAQVFVSMDPLFGACDLALEKMKLLQADLLIHLGHAPIHRPANVFHIPVYDKIPKKTFNALINSLEK
ncbi:MAG: diphthamide synthesis protein, partial [Candidatus Diapherotrites archaeon]|nr:diphthamide synthesis protein [Candidatus Diapherotrites archaeon]